MGNNPVTIQSDIGHQGSIVLLSHKLFTYNLCCDNILEYTQIPTFSSTDESLVDKEALSLTPLYDQYQTT